MSHGHSSSHHGHHTAHRAHHAHHPHHGHPHHGSQARKKRIRLFHPKKFWLMMATLALTVGVAVGEAQLSHTKIEPYVALKMTHNIQSSSFNMVDNTKRGVMRATYRVSFLNFGSFNPLARAEEPAKEGIKRVCFWEDEVEEMIYSANVVEVKMNDEINPGDEFRVEVYVENTGNMTWYGYSSGCLDKTLVHMGTTNELDRASVFVQSGATTGWLGDNRVKMVDDAVQPGEMATFAFSSVAPEEEGIYKEFFNLVAEDIEWFKDFEIGVEIPVGEVTEDDKFKAQFLKSMSANTRDLADERSLEVDLSDQSMLLKFGDQVAYSMTISSGAAATPTPTGTWHILNKQELRIGGAWPHYRMPYWQGFTSVGHGLHALPYLESDNGVFWEEALSHIGIPVSHGCLRMLPDDSITVYEFGEVGMELYIHY